MVGHPEVVSKFYQRSRHLRSDPFDLMLALVFNTRSCLLLSASGCVERPRGHANAFRSDELHNTRCCSGACIRTTAETIEDRSQRRLEETRRH